MCEHICFAGTGCNACYMESLHNVGLWEGDYQHPAEVREINEPPHDKTNKMAVRPAMTQISLGIRPV